MQGLNWGWIGFEAGALPLLAILVAYPFWRNASFIFGNIVGSMLICSAAIALILREFVEVDRVVQACIENVLNFLLGADVDPATGKQPDQAGGCHKNREKPASQRVHAASSFMRYPRPRTVSILGFPIFARSLWM